MSEFASRRVLITGGASGIGRELARQLSAEGATLGLLDRDAGSLAETAKLLTNTTVATAVADVTDLAGIRQAVAQIEQQIGATDILVANAGIGIQTPCLEYKAEDITTQINVNLIGVSNSVDAVLPGMLERKSGHLVVLSSLASYRGLPLMAGYCASKAGVRALFDSLRIELEPEGIAVTTICPGFIRTPLTSNLKTPHPNMMEVDYAVRCMVQAIRARKRYAAFPMRGRLQVALLRLLPRGWSDTLVRFMLRRLRATQTQTQ